MASMTNAQAREALDRMFGAPAPVAQVPLTLDNATRTSKSPCYCDSAYHPQGH